MHRNTAFSQPQNHILLMHLDRNTDKIDMKLDVVWHFWKRETIMWLLLVFTNFLSGVTSAGSPRTNTQSSCLGTTYRAKYRMWHSPQDANRMALADSYEHKMNVIKEYGLFHLYNGMYFETRPCQIGTIGVTICKWMYETKLCSETLGHLWINQSCVCLVNVCWCWSCSSWIIWVL
jgi:hypothetical protein